MGQGSSSSCSHEVCRQIDSGSITMTAIDLTLCLPDECLATVFGKLGCHDRNSCSLVCKRWSLVDYRSRNRLVLLARAEMSPSLPTLLSRFSSVSILSLKCSRKLVSVDDDAFSHIPICLPYLKKLKLKGCIDISDDGLQSFSLHSPHFLTKLSFASCGFGAKGINCLLSNCPSVQDLTLKRLRKLDSQNTQLIIHHNQACPYQLQRLCIKDLHNARLFIPLVSDSCKSLKTLMVCRSSGNWDRVLESLHGRITAISEIQMDNVQMGDAGLVAISSSCPDLQVLYLSRTTDCTDDGLLAIANSCKKLRKLHIDSWNRFGSRTIGDEGIYSVANKCSLVQELVLMGVPISTRSLNVLASNCHALERMALCNTDSVRDSEMAFIASKFSALKKLCIKNCPISDVGIEAIKHGCPKLVKLKVKRCRGITKTGVSNLQMQRSSLVISVDTGPTFFDGERLIVSEEHENLQNRRIPPPATLPNSGSRSRSTTTNVICSSRSAHLIRSRFENALQFGRRSPSF